MLAATISALGLVVTPAAAVPGGDNNFEPTEPPTPVSRTEPIRETTSPVAAPVRTCRMYGSSSGFGMLCNDGGIGKSLAQLLREGGIDVDREFCWDDGDLPDGFQPPEPTTGPGAWWLNTCLSFDGAVLRDNAELAYEFQFHAPGDERELNDRQRAAVALVTGRGQMPFLQAQASPISSPRVGQDIAFSLLCDSSKVDCSQADEGKISTNRLNVGGVTMYAELVHLKVLPLGAGRPDEAVNCDGAGLVRTAAQLDSSAADDPRVCRYRYERSSDDAGSGTAGDRYPSRVTAYWQIFYDNGSGPKKLGETYEKTTVNQVRVTEIQTLVVS